MKIFNKDKIIFFDTTLRDGEQAPGAAMTIEQKLEIAKHLAKMNVDVIEAGFPISSDAQFEATKLIAEHFSQGDNAPVICALSRAVEKDIERSFEAVKYAKYPRIHTFIATSDIHIKHKFNKTHDEILKIGIEAVKFAKTLTDDIEFSAEDATRSRVDFLCEVVEAAIDAGATTINIPDTVGFTMPSEYEDIINAIMKNVKNIDKAVLSVHCHDDLGFAVANSLVGVNKGVRQIECTINGIGERAGSAPLEEIVMALNVRKDLYNINCDINTKEIYPTSKLVERYSGFVVPPNKAIIGKNAFAHESGIHQDGMLKNRATYEIMSAESIGRSSEGGLVMGRHTGRHGFSDKIASMGYELSEDEISKLFEEFLQLADKKKEIYEDDIRSLASNMLDITSSHYELDYIHTLSGNSLSPSATIRLKFGDKVFEDAASGDGPVDAACKAINKITNCSLKIKEYDLRAVTKGQDALGEVHVILADEDDKVVFASGSSTDIVEASVKAYLNGVNRYINTK